MSDKNPVPSTVDHEPAGATASSHSVFHPFVSASEILPEFTVRSVLVGAILGIIFGASSVYLALKVGLTVSASIPIAVLSITIFRAFGKASILENNMTQTTGSAGESIAAGVVFTIPALLILGYDLEISRVSLIALTGGWLGVLLMIPLRRALIVKEHGKLMYPEGTACAEVLKVGEKGGLQAKLVFSGFGLGFLYKFLMGGLHLWPEVPSTPDEGPRFFPRAQVAAEISPELLGVGYIIGPRIAAIMVGGGVMSYLVLIPMIAMFGGASTTPLFPAGEKLISVMSPAEIRSNYVYYIGAGAVAAGGIISLIRVFPVIVSAFLSGLGDLRSAAAGGPAATRTERDMSMTYVLGGVAVITLVIAVLPQLSVGIMGALMMVVFAFIFVTVSSRITGEIGSSSNPVSGMTIATLLLTCLVFLMLGKTGADARVVALSVGAVVCIAAANAGATSQDLKTGFLVGATPRAQQIGLLIGVTTSAVVIGWTLSFLNTAKTTIEPVEFPSYTTPAPAGPAVTGPDGATYREVRLIEAVGEVPRGKYLVSEDGKIHYVVDPGVGGRATSTLRPESGAVAATATITDKTELGLDGQRYAVYKPADSTSVTGYLVDEAGQVHYRQEKVEKLEAPKAQLMALIIDGILEQKLPWGFVLLGVFISIVLELCGVSALPFAVGLYLPLSSSMPIFIGGMVRWGVEAWAARKNAKDEVSDAEADSSPGVLFSSGLIAGGTITGLVLAGLGLYPELAEKLNFGQKAPGIFENPFLGVVIFAMLAAVLAYVAREKKSGQ